MKQDPVRVTLMRLPTGIRQITTDRYDTLVPASKAAWTGMTIYQINGATRKELAMFFYSPCQESGTTGKACNHQEEAHFRAQRARPDDDGTRAVHAGQDQGTQELLGEWCLGVCNDQDALEAKVETTAPTTSRLSRSMFLSLVCHFEVVRMDS